MNDEYLKALKAGEKEYKARLAAGEYPYLPALDDICPDHELLTHKSLGLMEIPVDLIEGTKTRARQNAFAPGFLPLLEAGTEFEAKWSSLYNAQLEEGFNDPVKVYEYLHKFYVQEGNKRVSISRYLEMPTIMADVTRILPSETVMADHPEYSAFLGFYRVAPIYDIVCEDPEAYSEIAELLGQGTGPDADEWPENIVRELKTGFWRFCRVVKTLQGKMPDMALGDAFLVYLRIFIGDDLTAQPDKELEKKIKRIKSELMIARSEEKVSLVESSDDAVNAGSLITKAEKFVTRPDSLLSKVIPSAAYSKRNPLKAAFIYDKEPESSNWLLDHEAGRIYLEKAYGGLVETARFRTASFDDAAAAAAEWGADVVFTPSVRQINDTLRAAIKYENIKFLNCSVNLAHQSVRTYYAKLYEVKFLAGLVAGAASVADGTHKIGYCSDIPVYGTIAGINAFAVGAAMADPQVKIYLDWSERSGEQWWWNMLDSGVHVLSYVDSAQNKDGSDAYGVFRVERCEPGTGNDATGTCRIENLAAPVYKWGKLYEIIVRSILDGTYNSSAMDKKGMATNYWWGMVSGAVDIELKGSVSPHTKRLVEILRRGIISGGTDPFEGELRSQDGIVRKTANEPLTSMQVITMDWLYENIVGEIPKIDALVDEAKSAVKVGGIGKSKN